MSSNTYTPEKVSMQKQVTVRYLYLCCAFSLNILKILPLFYKFLKLKIENRILTWKRCLICFLCDTDFFLPFPILGDFKQRNKKYLL